MIMGIALWVSFFVLLLLGLLRGRLGIKSLCGASCKTLRVLEAVIGELLFVNSPADAVQKSCGVFDD